MKVAVFLCLTGLSCLQGNAQRVFSSAGLQSQVGDYTRAYLSKDIGISNLFGQPGGPRRWDFSQPLAPSESIHPTEIVATTDGGNGASLTDATYAERETGQTDGTQVWRYYSIATTQGRTTGRRRLARRQCQHALLRWPHRIRQTILLDRARGRKPPPLEQ